MILPTHANLARAWTWRPIPGCPGRSVLVLPFGMPGPDPTTLAPGVAWQRHRPDGARDPVWTAVLPDGGLIAYQRPDGSYVHTLNTPEGYARKLGQLGIG